MPALVLAGERPGGGLLARHFGAPANALVPVAGVPCIVRVVETLRRTRSIEGGLISGPVGAVVDQSPVFADLLRPGDFRWMAPEPGPAESAVAALASLRRWPVLMTTADHALLRPEMVDAFCEKASAVTADAVVGLARIEPVRAAFPDSRRTVLRFADGGRCGTNLFLLRNETGVRIVEFWKSLQADRKRPWRMARRIGAGVLVRYLAGRLSAAEALDRLGELAGCRLAWVEITDPRAAVDVDSVDDHALAEKLLGASGA